MFGVEGILQVAGTRHPLSHVFAVLFMFYAEVWLFLFCKMCEIF